MADYPVKVREGDPMVQMNIAIERFHHQQSRSWRPSKVVGFVVVPEHTDLCL